MAFFALIPDDHRFTTYKCQYVARRLDACGCLCVWCTLTYAMMIHDGKYSRCVYITHHSRYAYTTYLFTSWVVMSTLKLHVGRLCTWWWSSVVFNRRRVCMAGWALRASIPAWYLCSSTYHKVWSVRRLHVGSP